MRIVTSLLLTLLLVTSSLADADPDNLEKISVALRTKNLATRLKAAKQLAELGEKGRPATETLMGAMLETYPAGADEYLETLEKIAPDLHKHAVPLLVDASATNRKKVVVALSQLGADARPLVPLLLNLRRTIPIPRVTGRAGLDEQRKIIEENRARQMARIPALHALVEIAPDDSRVVREIVTTIAYTPSVNMPSVGGRPRQPMRNPERIVALELVKKVKADPKQLTDALVSALDTGERIKVLAVLGDMGSEAKGAVPALKKLKLDASQETRDAVADALTKIEK